MQCEAIVNHLGEKLHIQLFISEMKFSPLCETKRGNRRDAGRALGGHLGSMGAESDSLHWRMGM